MNVFDFMGSISKQKIPNNYSYVLKTGQLKKLLVDNKRGKEMTIFYFTGTGNSLAIAKSIGGSLISIPQVVDSDNLNYKDDVIGIVFPIYSLREPKMVRRFLDIARLEADYIFAIGTYGNMPGAAMSNLQKRAVSKGRGFNYTNHILMVDNFLPIFEMGKQIEKLPKKKVKDNTAKIVSDIKNRKQMNVRGGLASRAVTKFVAANNPNGEYAKKYIVNNQCDKCGICPKVCPSKNITISDNITFHDRCEMCFACLHLCPKNAIHLKNERSEKRWRNPEVSLNEVIESNNRE